MTDMFPDKTAIVRAVQSLPASDSEAVAAATRHDADLTKPAGALARLEDCIRHLAGWQRRPIPRLDAVTILIFAGNHGVTTRGVSAYPAEVTVQMVANFERGGAAIN
ncbi:nicotinate-nucleotide--dimethylbenzimidazole phosphoribosyltransferase, partial [Ferrovibrio sp.]|uniref:nicotinate-nucleotide--dimethylbenzimidazole phosphoribosyltransferase n=1 Tax=Ferrovibrio sp. TaxID=1917215 RepID=UPI0025C2FE0D